MLSFTLQKERFKEGILSYFRIIKSYFFSCEIIFSSATCFRLLKRFKGNCKTQTSLKMRQKKKTLHIFVFAFNLSNWLKLLLILISINIFYLTIDQICVMKGVAHSDESTENYDLTLPLSSKESF